jgi:hypothetical protein
MIHEHCRTYFNVAPLRCEHCGLYWCPRCRTWFAKPETIPASAPEAGKEQQ